ncbi:hypothetical protein ABCK93_004723 [Salmonella enterica subsp. enterica serovar Bredeney]|nr:hypothetical protein [Salmonella enterica subsp. enterica serovar Bredeney]
MKDLIVQRYNIVTVHSNGETFDDLREKPNGIFCYYREANESHKDILAEYSEPVNEELLDALQLALHAMNEMGDILNFHDLAEKNKVDELTPAFDKARAAISKALGEE